MPNKIKNYFAQPTLAQLKAPIKRPGLKDPTKFWINHVWDSKTQCHVQKGAIATLPLKNKVTNLTSIPKICAEAVETAPVSLHAQNQDQRMLYAQSLIEDEMAKIKSLITEKLDQNMLLERADKEVQLTLWRFGAHQGLTLHHG